MPIQDKFYGKSQEARKALIKRRGSCSKPKVKNLAQSLAQSENAKTLHI